MVELLLAIIFWFCHAFSSTRGYYIARGCSFPQKPVLTFIGEGLSQCAWTFACERHGTREAILTTKGGGGEPGC